MQPQDIEVGTSGWLFEDWRGTFYPLRVPKSKWLEYYSARFSVGEINSTYYRIAPPATFESINRRTPPEFRFTAKVHADVTHKQEKPDRSLQQLTSAIEPLRCSDKLSGLLAQFPAGFRYNSQNLDYVLKLPEFCDGIRLCIEFRSRSWLGESIAAPLRQSGLTWVCPDEPDLPDLMPFEMITTSDLLYVRLHGRNRQAWYDRTAGDRYDYVYKEEELIDIGKKLLASEPAVHRAVIFFNNCHAGQAVRNAWWLKNWLAALFSSENSEKVPDGFDLSAD